MNAIDLTLTVLAVAATGIFVVGGGLVLPIMNIAEQFAGRRRSGARRE